MKKLIIFLIIICNSMYLTQVVKHLINSKIQYTFVFFYFIAIFSIIFHFTFKYFSNRKISYNLTKKNLYISIIIALLLVIAGNESFIIFGKTTSTVEVTATGNKNNNSNGAEVWLTAINIDGNSLVLSSLQHPEGWEFKEGALLSYKDQPSTIKLSLPQGKKVSLQFLKHDWSGEVLIKDGFNQEIVDLFSKSPSSDYKYNVTGNKVAVSSGNLLINYSLSIILLASIIFLLLMLSINNSIFYSILHILIMYCLNNYIKIDKYSSITICIFEISLGITYIKFIYNKKMQIQFPEKRTLLFMIFLSFLISSSLISNILSFELSIKNISIFVLLNLLITPIEIVIFSITNNKIMEITYASDTSKMKVLMYALPFFIISQIYWLSFYPATMSPDSIDQWNQTITGNFTGSHPIFHTFYIWIIKKIWGSPASVALVQIIICSLMIGYISYYLEKIGIKRRVVLLINLIYSINPVNNIMSIALWKDIPFSLCLLLITILLLKLYISDGLWLKSVKHQSYLIITLALIYLFRHNGVISVLGSIIILFLLYKKYWRELLKISLFIVVIIVSVKLIISFIFNATPGPTYGSMAFQLHQVGTMVHSDVVLTNKEKNVLEKIMPLKYWAGGDNYAKYDVGYVLFNNIFNDHTFKENKNEFLKTWIELVLRNPKIAFNDWTSMTSLIWQIKQPNDGYTSTAILDIYPNELGLKQTSLLPNTRDILMKIVGFTSSSEHNWMFWRPAISIYLMIFFGFLFVRRNTYKAIIIFVPILAQIAGIMLVIPAQDSRYFYFCSLVLPIIILLSLYKVPKVKSTALDGSFELKL
ncbi:hypothetical protein SAMN04487897_102602 [Paenibacillus sp. yr247]|uniref:DUF6020 family protein n=1 Tax=Paenibacillus sp. yr247 TaxID=1761880 RepID=UPI000886F23F|nr:DUF6020 family protein [Paenibacillus sp. yr247]SDN35080.1 hypothetical protein SAMN04487897_102602 [Paenibacillus sp. yr247]